MWSQTFMHVLAGLVCVRSLEISSGFSGFDQFGRPIAPRVVRGPPEKVYRVKLILNALKQAMDVAFEGTKLIDFYDLRLRWSEPTLWNDGPDNEARSYEYMCWITLGEQTRVLTTRKVNWYFQAYHENYRFPSNFPAMMQCKVRPINGDQLPGEWSFSESYKISDIPIYFPGMDGLDLRSFSDADILAVLARVSARDAQEAEDQDKRFPQNAASQPFTTRT